MGVPDKILSDLRNSKGGRQQSGTPLEMLVSGVNHNVLTRYVVVLGQATRFSNVSASLLPNLTLAPEAAVTGTLMPLLKAAIRQSVPSQIFFSFTSGFVA
jgi:hypothetical protein